MSLDRLLKLASILFIFVVACTSNQQINTADSCIIFDQKKNWYKAAKKSYDKWDTPIALQLAIINQESSFSQFAKPERKKLLGIFPWFKTIYSIWLCSSHKSYMGMVQN